MAVHAAVGASQRAQPTTLEVSVLPSPIKGIDGRLNLASNDPMNAVYAYNMVPSEYGMRTRLGYREWVTNLETGPGLGTGVGTLIPYTSTAAAAVSDKLFAVTNEGIWDVSLRTATPVLALTFPIVNFGAGFGNFSHYTDQNGDDLILYADEANGLQQYDPVLDTWAAATGITGVDPLNIVFVVVHKLRVWFAERNTTNGWYLAVGAATGAATKFSFGAKFRHGGDLVGLYNWTIDSGAGIDDFLVAISRGGDVLPYRGEDPSAAATWSIVGTFFIGEIPIGRRIASEYGGDLRVLSDYGLTSMADLLRGVAGTSSEKEDNVKIARFLRRDMELLRSQRGWDIILSPNEGTLIVNTPRRQADVDLEYVLSLSVSGWGFWRELPMLSGQAWQSVMHVGTLDNRVLRMDVDTDNELIDGTPGQPLSWSMLQNFLDAGTPSRFKRGHFIRPNFISEQPVGVTTRFVYDFDIPANLALPPTTFVGNDLWDTGVWDTAVWSEALFASKTVTTGGWGRGRTFGIAMRGASFSRLTLVSTDVMWTVEGMF